MNIRDVYSAKAIALRHHEVASNKQAYLGVGLFPRNKKAGLGLKWVKTSKGLAVSLMPSAFDTRSTIRSREGFKMTETEMAFFKESTLVKEQDEQEIMRIQDSAEPFAKEVLDRIYDDVETLLEGAEVVPERMRMQLLSAEDGHPGISISADGATYKYNYDPDGSYEANNFTELIGTDMWSDTVNSNPIQDVMDAQDAVEAKTGTKPSILLVSKLTMNWLKQNVKVRDYTLAQNVTANIIMTDNRVKETFLAELGVTIIVYSKSYKDEAGMVKKFYPDGMATLIPDGALGNTWYGMTPEERTLMSRPGADVEIVDGGIAVSVTVTEDPVQTKTTVSEICLPSFERMDETYTLKVGAVSY
jgi:hypothetical protein